MNELIGRVFDFEKKVYEDSRALYSKLANHGQEPKALMISCADSRVVPEQIMQAQPGDLFVCRNAGNIVPPYATQNGGVTSTVEYAVLALGIRDIIVCGHSDCGAMKGLAGDPAKLEAMPNVVAWLRHGSAARQVVDSSYADLEDGARVRAVSLENVVAQLAHLRTHPSVAAGIARGEIALHGWFVDIHAGQMLALNGETGRFESVRGDRPLPVALPAARRLAADFITQEAAE
ncbi:MULTISPECIES: carbonic anhydrase [unclassified Sphingomonas]|uniref:carbonic anhydrase n=1 Tax=unclassified Sphingomonas TaxID=196159 RepID=UPI001D118451|nr:carbonic anhydrase [Sphingomonas sp. IC4-52]MCC2980626.1 carbonic anhydrase [Sphingomonas sp. IC4-52]MCD2316737.1 carbonic anhydrase [Sphingomonas sp. IC-11]